MAKPTSPPPPSPAKAVQADPCTVEQAAALFGVRAADIIGFRDYGTHVVAVTTSGCKMDSRHLAHEAPV